MVGAKFVQNTLIMQYLITCNSSQFSIILDLLTLILLGILIRLTSAGNCLLFSSGNCLVRYSDYIFIYRMIIRSIYVVRTC